MIRQNIRKLLAIGGALLMTLTTGTNINADSTVTTRFGECFNPMPIVGELNEDCWGADLVGPRDQDNGLEDYTMGKYSYWDGGVIKGDDNKYYMFASRWDERLGHEGWAESVAVYAVSDNLYGPYEDKGVLWPDYYNGAGHNVFPFVVSEGDPLYDEGYRYAVFVSDVHKGVGFGGYSPANGSIHIAKDLNGPWELVDNGNKGIMNVNRKMAMVNVSFGVNPDGKYVAINRYGYIATADSLADEWDIQVEGLWNKVNGMPASDKCVEDAVIWYSNGLYHIIVNKWDARIAYYLSSTDGVSDWVLHTGAAYTPDDHFLRYEDGTINNWYKIERPNVFIENDKVKAMIFAVIDTVKEEDFGGDTHGSKVLIVPFASDRFEYLITHDDPMLSRPGGQPLSDTSLVEKKPDTNYGGSNYIYMCNDKDNNNDKFGLIKYDIAECTDGTGKIVEAKLSLMYLCEKDEGDPNQLWIVDDEFVKNKREHIQCKIADSNWDEFKVTYNSKPELISLGDVKNLAISPEFIPTSGGISEVTIDVTDIVNAYINKYPDKDEISFELNETADGYDICIGSYETGSAFEPRLNILRESAVKKPEATAAPATNTAAATATSVNNTAATTPAVSSTNSANAKADIPKVTLTKATRKAGTAKIKFRKVKKAKGYEIVYSKDKKFKKNVKSITCKTSPATIKLPKKGTYFVKVRAFNIVSGKKQYGKYSNTKKL